MDLKAYFRDVADVEETLEEFVVVKSLPTSSGGRAGRLAEVSRYTGARLIVDGFAEVASTRETQKFRQDAEKARRKEEQARQACQVGFSMISEGDLKALVGNTRGAKE